MTSIHTETQVEMGRTHSKNEGQQVDQTLHRVAAKEREEIKRTTMQKMARRHNEEVGNHLERKATDRKQWKTSMEDYILQWMDKSLVNGERVLSSKYCTNCKIIFARGLVVFHFFQDFLDF